MTRPDGPDEPVINEQGAAPGAGDAPLTAPVRQVHDRRNTPGEQVTGDAGLLARLGGWWRAGEGMTLAGVVGAALWIAGALFAMSLVFVLWFRFVPPGQTLLMTLRGWQGQDVVHEWTPLTEINPRLVEAVIAAEDTKFCRHVGFDFGELKAALAEARAGKGLRGASTISQQTAKNVYLSGGGGFLRKGIEAYFTGLMEVFWSKRRIMEVYLNVAEWGDGYFGAGATAQGRFSKAAGDLNKREAALLASVLPNPAAWRVDPPGPYVQRRSGQVRARMDIVRRDGLAACVLAP